jgi:hypothetical protein
VAIFYTQIERSHPPWMKKSWEKEFEV